MTDIKQEWLTARDLAKRMTKDSDFEITPPYVQRLGREGKIELWKLNKQMYLYNWTSARRYLDEKKKQPQPA